MIGAIVLAGGAGKRMGAGMNKQYLTIDGCSMLSYALRSMAQAADELIVVAAAGEEERAAMAIWEAGLDRTHVQIVQGGAERQDSVRNALEAMPDQWDIVFIHDGARPFVPHSVIERLKAEVAPGVGVIPGLAVTDTIKQVDAAGRVVKTPNRCSLRAAQTPQCFMAKEILLLHERALKDQFQTTDDAALFEHYGYAVQVVEGSPLAKKLTYAMDMEQAGRLKKEWEDMKKCELE